MLIYHLGYAQIQKENEVKKAVWLELTLNHKTLVNKYPKLDSIVHHIVRDLFENGSKGHLCSHKYENCVHSEETDASDLTKSSVFIIVNFLTNIEKYPHEKDFRIYPNRNYALKKFIK